MTNSPPEDILVVRQARVLTLDDAGNDWAEADVVVQGADIVAVGPDAGLPWLAGATRVIDGRGLLAPDGYVNVVLGWIGIGHTEWLSGNPYSVIAALTYGYIPFFILPLYAALERLDGRLIEASRDLGASSIWTFVRVTLPLSIPGLMAASVIVVLPMFGDYYTNDLISASPRTAMLGNEINLFVQGGSQIDLGASMVIVLMLLLELLGRELGITKERVRQIESGAREKLRKYSQNAIGLIP